MLSTWNYARFVSACAYYTWQVFSATSQVAWPPCTKKCHTIRESSLRTYVAHDFSTSLDTHGIPVVVVAWLLTYSEDLSHSWSSSCLIDVVAAYNILQHTNCFALACHRYTSWPHPTSFAHAQCACIAISACPPYKRINPYH